MERPIGAQFVDFFLLGEASLAAAVEDIVEFAATFTVEYPWQRSFLRRVGLDEALS
jgi:hypothetical protein